jgi:signal transduction histidine kinase
MSSLGLMSPLFSNLIQNALKYSRKGVYPGNRYLCRRKSGKGKRKERKWCIEGKKYSRIFVKDNGIGFDQKYGEKIFDMFVRLHGNSEYEGTGIGLALCKQIVEKHEGYISALSKEDVGSTFIVSLPLQ